MSNDTLSGYDMDKKKTIGQVTREWANDLLAEAKRAEEIECGWCGDCEECDEFSEYGYGAEVKTLVEITIAGGGPGADITFTYDSDGHLEGACLNYYEFGGSDSHKFTYEEAQRLEWMTRADSVREASAWQIQTQP